MHALVGIQLLFSGMTMITVGPAVKKLRWFFELCLLASLLLLTRIIVVANAVGSNITNILLIVGMLAVVSGGVIITRDLLKTELPVFFISTTLFIAIVFDGSVDRVEAVLLLGTFAAYLWYLFFDAGSEKRDESMPKSSQRSCYGTRAIDTCSRFSHFFCHRAGPADNALGRNNDAFILPVLCREAVQFHLA